MRDRGLPRVLAGALVVLAACAVVVLCSRPGRAGTRGVYYAVETGANEWRLAETGERLSAVSDAPGGRPTALAIPVKFPQPASAEVRRRSDWTGCDTLSFDVYVPLEAPADVQAMAYVIDAGYHWYQALNRPYLKRGKWNTVSFDISDDSEQWQFTGHFRPWDGYAKRRLRALGIKLISKKVFDGEVFLDNIRVRPLRPAGVPEQRLLNVRTSGSRLERFERFEIAFDLPRTYENPFDPEQIDIRGSFIAPSGAVTAVPGFFYQDFVRNLRQKTEYLTPVGRGEWRIRFTPTEVGTYRYCIEIMDGDYVKTAYRSFEVVPSKRRGFVRISRRDPGCFEFDNGEYYYPIGHNICATFDVRNSANLGIELFYDRGTSAYDSYLDGMIRGHENLARVWMTAWNLALEWTEDYKPHYRGLGRYSLENAWRLDYILDRAEKAGIYVMITFDPHGHWMTPMSIKTESDWQYNPYNIRNGGCISSPAELFVNPTAKKYYKRRLRYILARWGYSTAVFCWEIFNEIDLAHEYYKRMAPTIIKWEVEMARYIKEHDQGKHLVTTNRYFWDKAHHLWQQSEIDFTNAHFFSKNPIEQNRMGLLEMQRYGKIFLVTESAQDVYGGTPAETERFMHVTLWSSYMSPMAAVAMPWWWDFIDERDLYFHFAALRKYAEGEDRRGMNLVMGGAVVMDAKSNEPTWRFAAECLRNNKYAYLWVYDRAMVGAEVGEMKPPESLAVALSGLSDGEYHIEFWDTYKGSVIGTGDAKLKSGLLVFTLPKFEKDIACKVRPASGEKTSP